MLWHAITDSLKPDAKPNNVPMKLYLNILLTFSTLLATALTVCADDNVIITEFMASNSRTLADENGQYPDWIELFNAGTNAVNLGGWYLTDDATKLKKWQFPATNINAGAFLVVFASGKNRQIPGLPLHTNFKLSSASGYLGLIKPDGTTIASQFSPTYPTQAPDVSYGLGVLTTNQTLISTNSPVTVLVPSGGADGLNWTAIVFDDSTWIAATNGVGYGTTNVAQADYSSTVLPMAPVG